MARNDTHDDSGRSASAGDVATTEGWWQEPSSS